MVGLAAGTGEEISGLVMLFGYVLSFAYYIFFTGYCGQTPGKMAVRIKRLYEQMADEPHIIPQMRVSNLC